MPNVMARLKNRCFGKTIIKIEHRYMMEVSHCYLKSQLDVDLLSGLVAYFEIVLEDHDMIDLDDSDYDNPMIVANMLTTLVHAALIRISKTPPDYQLLDIYVVRESGYYFDHQDCVDGYLHDHSITEQAIVDAFNQAKEKLVQFYKRQSPPLCFKQQYRAMLRYLSCEWTGLANRIDKHTLSLESVSRQPDEKIAALLRIAAHQLELFSVGLLEPIMVFKAESLIRKINLTLFHEPGSEWKHRLLEEHVDLSNDSTLPF